jgi:amidase
MASDIRSDIHSDALAALEDATIAQLHAAMRTGALSAQSLTQRYLDRIDAFDGKGPALASILAINPTALNDAARLDDAMRSGQKPGPLHGIPVVVKDNVETAGLRTTAGSLALADHVPLQDAFLIRKLKAAGAIILAKTNLHEFASSGETFSSLGGQTRNPYDLERTPGGSSGGTGAAVAANFGAAGIGTDTINSVRSPASANSLVGLRPTIGLVSRSGIIPYGLTQDTAGPITRSVADAACLLDAIAGTDPADPSTRDSKAHQPPGYTAFLDANGLRGTRIGLVRSLFGTEDVHQETSAVMSRALEVMQGHNATLVELIEAFDCGMLLDQTSVHHHEVLRDLDDYLGNLPGHMTTRSLAAIMDSGGLHPGVDALFRRIATLKIDSADYRERLQRRQALQQQLLALLDTHRLDALLFPHQKRLVVPIGEAQVERNGVLAGITGFPAIVVPAGFSPQTSSAPLGVPIGLELLARPYAESTLIRLAFAFEQATQHRRPPKSVPW